MVTRHSSYIQWARTILEAHISELKEKVTVNQGSLNNSRDNTSEGNRVFHNFVIVPSSTCRQTSFPRCS